MGFHKGSAWQSFPSSHTTGAFALSLGLAWFYPRGRGLFLGLALITAAQRVLHGAHFVSDTLAGMGIALLMTRWSLRAKLAGRLIVLAPPWAQAWWMGA
jgi:membrane-associated phospholipid phosphatase